MESDLIGLPPVTQFSPPLSPVTANLILPELPGVGASIGQRLRDSFGGAAAFLATPADSLADILPPETCQVLSQIQQQAGDHPLVRRAEQIQQRCRELDIALLSVEDPDYPPLLRELPDPPPLLYLRGDSDNLTLPQMAMVGSRNATPTGGEDARCFARQLAQLGFAITSGLAAGIDGAAHRGALDGGGPTLAVLGNGLDRIYPARHARLAQAILDSGGTLISELPPGIGPKAGHFPRRNRIISGLSLGVLVVEAAPKSGSLITARLAVEQGREVFAVPGSIHSPVSRGCHRLLKEGASLVESVDDMAEPLQGLLGYAREQAHRPPPATLPDTTPAPMTSPTTSPTELPPPALNDEEALVYTSIGYENTTMDTLQSRTRLPVNSLMSVLVGLELKGLIQHTAGGFQRKIDGGPA